jgi:putative peptidoglycan lipid II flippase
VTGADQPTERIPVVTDDVTVVIPAQKEPEKAASSVARSSSIMAIGSLVSRITGFARAAVIAAALGTAIGNSYQLAVSLPQMIYELLVGGILTSVVVPLIVKARKTDADRGEAFTHRLLTAAALMLGIATISAVLLAPVLTWMFANEQTTGDDRVLINTLLYLMLPAIFFYGLAAVLAAVLNTRDHFFAPMWAPILNNFVVITAAVVFIALPGPDTLNPSTITPAQVLVIGVGTTLGIVLQTASLWPALRKVGFRWKWRFDLYGTGLGEAVRLGTWALVYVAVSQVGLVPVMWIAKYAGDRVAGGNLVHNNAFLLFMMVHGIVAVSILTALMPRMSAAAAESRWADLTANLSLGARLSAVVLVPATAAYVALGVPLAITAFQWGEFGSDAAHATGYAVMAAGIGLVPFAISQMQIFAFYSMRDTKTPALLNIPVVVTKVAFDISVWLLVDPEYIIVGLMCGNTVSYVVAVIISGRLLRKRVGAGDTARITRTLVRLTVAAIVAGAIGGGLSYGIQAWLGDGKLGSFVALLVGGLALGVAFVAGAVFLRISEVTEAWGTVRRRIPGLSR